MSTTKRKKKLKPIRGNYYRVPLSNLIFKVTLVMSEEKYSYIKWIESGKDDIMGNAGIVCSESLGKKPAIEILYELTNG